MADPRSPGGTRALRRWTMGRRLMRRPAAVVLVLSLGLGSTLATSAERGRRDDGARERHLNGGRGRRLIAAGRRQRDRQRRWTLRRLLLGCHEQCLPRRRLGACSCDQGGEHDLKLISVSHTGALGEWIRVTKRLFSPDGRDVVFTSTAMDLIDHPRQGLLRLDRFSIRLPARSGRSDPWCDADREASRPRAAT